MRAALPLLLSTRSFVIFCLGNIAFAMFYSMPDENGYQVHVKKVTLISLIGGNDKSVGTGMRVACLIIVIILAQ
ncbi:TPA: hypothetical protein F6W26_21680 [Citrobacter amalonaticus]|uniref:Uncharacterized protein n=1 Tax=Citrobacter amalonaticus TaxID=35703 RepID=A0ABY0HQI8_CITAM|nr:hypothetical protein C2U53_28275 [Citrobacter sp. CFNIH10]MBY5256365.1 hypothetical protein [Citrobacter amalonaticus]PNP32711.1 hypothetical protein AL525_001870 [Citrobacter amalonaticus]QDK86850.1 hypothetical protein FEO47_15735 [Citrobacter amalonaticus]RYT41535.1 hypothetical protein EAJ18_19715 [Citrobacter amalonaticus]